MFYGTMLALNAVCKGMTHMKHKTNDWYAQIGSAPDDMTTAELIGITQEAWDLLKSRLMLPPAPTPTHWPGNAPAIEQLEQTAEDKALRITRYKMTMAYRPLRINRHED